MPSAVRRICFVTGTRAEFGLMDGVLRAIQNHRRLELQLLVTGMHLDPARGRSIDQIRKQGWRIDGVIPWRGSATDPTANAIATGKAIASIAKNLDRLRSDIVLVVGDRVEAFAGATAGHVAGKLVAHIHGGDRALGLVDDSLRHAITKLSHIHFPATAESARRIRRLGEDPFRIFRAGSPGLDQIRHIAASRAELVQRFGDLARRRFALLVLHPQSSDPAAEARAARMVLSAVEAHNFEQIVIVFPNNDPGSSGIAGVWDALRPGARRIVRRDLPRPLFLGLMREAAVLIGNSSSGIIEAASFGTPVLDIGHRQLGRERGKNVVHAPMERQAIARALSRIYRNGRARRSAARNIYGAGGAAKLISETLATVDLAPFRQKLIAY